MKKDELNESKLALKFGVGAGHLGVICCVGPLILILMGVGGASTQFGLDSYKPVFIGMGPVLLAGASWYVIRKRNQCCTVKNRLKGIQIFLLIFGVGIGSYLTLQYGLVPVLSDVASNKVASQHQVSGVLRQPLISNPVQQKSQRKNLKQSKIKDYL